MKIVNYKGIQKVCVSITNFSVSLCVGYVRILSDDLIHFLHFYPNG